jgi:hypothetical protein
MKVTDWKNVIDWHGAGSAELAGYGTEVEVKETDGLLDYIKPLNGPVGTVFYLDFT